MNIKQFPACESILLVSQNNVKGHGEASETEPQIINVLVSSLSNNSTSQLLTTTPCPNLPATLRQVLCFSAIFAFYIFSVLELLAFSLQFPLENTFCFSVLQEKKAINCSCPYHRLYSVKSTSYHGLKATRMIWLKNTVLFVRLLAVRKER